ncbi:unnamed protein product [Bursaphelenchus xylophilus]|uniref:(pine wood nematode) hypothetical protein n=1 Tax=Bursaphelenchus xylophilus TaxID=6326 RepID=A0A1I7S7E2_BURXY|nr:unnamed protein product [Bursaphelenchus xylophilus]CAG9084983.1 unnamed protein product [Bursaphelenchus xylophilus]
MEELNVINDRQPQLPHFLAKLWSILDDTQYENAICWDKSGESFHIVDSYLFKNAVLPRYFKHNNLNSFVRQLNLYGFRKIPIVGNACLLNENGDNLHFSHPFFIKGNFHLLQHIKRNAVKGTGGSKAKQEQAAEKRQVSVPEDDLVCMFSELKLMREKQNTMKNTIRQLTRDNILLWQKMAALENSQNKQQENVGKLVQFLMALVQSQKRVHNNSQRIMQLDELDERARRNPSPKSNRAYNQSPVNCLAIQRGQGIRPTLDFGILDGIQRELTENSFDMTSNLSMNAENALLEGLQLRQRAIEEGGPYLEDGILQNVDDEHRSSHVGGSSLQRYRANGEPSVKRSFKPCLPSYSPNIMLKPKKYAEELLQSYDVPSTSQHVYEEEDQQQMTENMGYETYPSLGLVGDNETFYYVDEQGNQFIPELDLDQIPNEFLLDHEVVIPQIEHSEQLADEEDV